MRSLGNDRIILTKKIKKINTNSKFGSRNQIEGKIKKKEQVFNV